MKNSIGKSLFIILILLQMITGCDNPADNHDDEEHTRAVGIVIYSGDTIVVRYERDDAVSGRLTVLPGALSGQFNLMFIAEDGDEFVPHLDESALGYTIADTTIAVLWQPQGEEGSWTFYLRGRKAGETSMRFKIMHDDHPDFTSKAVPVVVQEGIRSVE